VGAPARNGRLKRFLRECEKAALCEALESHGGKAAAAAAALGMDRTHIYRLMRRHGITCREYGVKPPQNVIEMRAFFRRTV